MQGHFDQEQGGAPDLRSFLAGKAATAHFYCCGPTPMLNAFEKTCEELGLANAHLERFAAAEDVAPAQDSAYVAFLARTQKSITVTAGTSLLDALLEAGVDIDNNCRDGVCGACETVVLEGTPDHRDKIGRAHV